MMLSNSGNIKSKLLVIGGGISSAVTSALITEYCNPENIQICVWDKARGAGGRMSTSRSPINSNCTADLGAQFIHTRPDYLNDHKKIYDELLTKSLIQPFMNSTKTKENIIDYVAPEGSSSVVKYFFQKSGIAPTFQHHVNNIKINSDNKIEVYTQNGSKDVFNAVILTMPVPQILDLPGMDSILSNDMKIKLSNVKYNSKYALGLFFEKYGDCVIPNGYQYYKNEDVYEKAAHDPQKRGLSNPTASSVVFITSDTFGAKYIDTPIPEVEKILLEEASQKFPIWPNPTSTKCQRWRYCQVQKPFEGSPKAVILNENPLIIAGGDAFVSQNANVGDCIASAYEITKKYLV